MHRKYKKSKKKEVRFETIYGMDPRGVSLVPTSFAIPFALKLLQYLNFRLLQDRPPLLPHNLNLTNISFLLVLFFYKFLEPTRYTGSNTRRHSTEERDLVR